MSRTSRKKVIMLTTRNRCECSEFFLISVYKPVDSVDNFWKTAEFDRFACGKLCFQSWTIVEFVY